MKASPSFRITTEPSFRFNVLVVCRMAMVKQVIGVATVAGEKGQGDCRARLNPLSVLTHFVANSHGWCSLFSGIGDLLRRSVSS